MIILRKLNKAHDSLQRVSVIEYVDSNFAPTLIVSQCGGFFARLIANHTGQGIGLLNGSCRGQRFYNL